MSIKQPHEAAFREFLAHRTMLKAYVFAIVRDAELAEDALSDAAVEIARSWANFDPQRAAFPNWARGVARRVALNQLRKKYASAVTLDAETLESVASHIDQLGNETYLEHRKKVLQQCVAKMSKVNQDLIRLRYTEGRSYREIAAMLQREANALYVAFNRLHLALGECVQRGMSS